MAQAFALRRLRAARLRPSAARIGVLQVLEAAAPERLSAEEIYRTMLRRGTRVSLSTVYRTLAQCHEAGLLLRELDDVRMWRYGASPQDPDVRQALELTCPVSGRVVLLADEELHDRLLAAAQEQGISLGGRVLSIQAR